jgi:multiple sugar transport system ATP-binding protein
MRAELSKLHSQLKTTSLYVTHDQVEAMTMGSKIAIIKDGILQQSGTPLDIYENPVNQFVAGFIGSPPMNFFEGHIQQKDGELLVTSDAIEVTLPESYKQKLADVSNTDGNGYIFGIRPEHMHDAAFYSDKKKETAIINGLVDVVEPMGAETYVHSTCGSGKFVARVSPYTAATYGATLKMLVETDKLHIFDKTSLLNLIKEI